MAIDGYERCRKFQVQSKSHKLHIYQIFIRNRKGPHSQWLVYFPIYPYIRGSGRIGHNFIFQKLNLIDWKVTEMCLPFSHHSVTFQSTDTQKRKISSSEISVWSLDTTAIIPASRRSRLYMLNFYFSDKHRNYCNCHLIDSVKLKGWNWKRHSLNMHQARIKDFMLGGWGAILPSL